MTRDPVCRMKIDPARAAAQAQYAGTVYYFCSAKCQRAFQDDPGRFAGSVSAEKPRGAQPR